MPKVCTYEQVVLNIFWILNFDQLWQLKCTPDREIADSRSKYEEEATVSTYLHEFQKYVRFAPSLISHAVPFVQSLVTKQLHAHYEIYCACAF
jgi:hypothetical protein